MSHNKKKENKVILRSLPLLIEMSGEGTVAKWLAARKGKACSNEKRKVLNTWQVKHKQEIKNLIKN